MRVTRTGPVVAPVSLADAKAFLRIDHDAEDALIAGLLRSAAEICEMFTGQVLIAAEFRETIAARADWQRLTMTPVRAIAGVEGLPAEGSAFPLPVHAYAIDIDAAGDGWVRVTQPGAAGRAVVSYTAGIAAEAEGVAEPLRQGVLRLAAHLYAHRDAPGAELPPAAVAALWRPWRRMRLA